MPISGKFGRISGNLAEPLALTGCLVTAGYLDSLTGDIWQEVLPDSWPEVLPEPGGKSFLTLVFAGALACLK